MLAFVVKDVVREGNGMQVLYFDAELFGGFAGCAFFWCFTAFQMPAGEAPCSVAMGINALLQEDFALLKNNDTHAYFWPFHDED